MALTTTVTVESWPLREPFEIAGQVMIDLPLILVELSDEHGHTGRAEAAGIDYDGETCASMKTQVEAVAGRLRPDTQGEELASWLPRGGARNALDCALWDLRAKRSGTPVWAAAGLQAPAPVVTAWTIGMGSIAQTRLRARRLAAVPFIKLKVDGDRHLEWIRVVRDEAPAARLAVDANQSWSRALLEQLLPDLAALGVEFIEQPLRRGAEDELDGLRPPIPLVADESCTDRGSLPALLGRYQAVNVKLDKCGGLTEALALARSARAMGFDIMVGNMCGTSLGMAPAFLVAQLARWADLDGPLLQQGDREHALHYDRGIVQPPSPQLWG